MTSIYVLFRIDKEFDSHYKTMLAWWFNQPTKEKVYKVLKKNIHSKKLEEQSLELVSLDKTIIFNPKIWCYETFVIEKLKEGIYKYSELKVN